LKRYDHVEQSIDKFGGKVLVRADEFLVLEGGWNSGSRSDDSRPERITVIESPDMAQLRRWYDSQDYARLKEIRTENPMWSRSKAPGPAESAATAHRLTIGRLPVR